MLIKQSGRQCSKEFSVVIMGEKNEMVNEYMKAEDFPFTTFVFFSFWEKVCMFYYCNKIIKRPRYFSV